MPARARGEGVGSRAQGWPPALTYRQQRTRGLYGVGLEEDVNITSDLGFSKITGQSEFPYRWEEVRREEEM